MTSVDGLREAMTGLIVLAAGHEQVLLAAAPPAEEGSPQCWAALPVIAHNTEFKRQQVTRLAVARYQVRVLSHPKPGGLGLVRAEQPA